MVQPNQLRQESERTGHERDEALPQWLPGTNRVRATQCVQEVMHDDERSAAVVPLLSAWASTRSAIYQIAMIGSEQLAITSEACGPPRLAKEEADEFFHHHASERRAIPRSGDVQARY